MTRFSFNRASAEAPPGSAAYEVPRAYCQWLHGFLRDLAAAAGAPDPDQLASQIHLLYDGAMLAASLDGNPGVTAASRSAAEALLDAALFGAAPLGAPLLDATRLHPAASPGAGGGRHRKPDQPAAAHGLQI